MLFSRQRDFSNSEKELIQNLLEGLIGMGEESCQDIIEEKGFIFLDKWNKKMGFIKEEKDKYLILSLYFNDSRCNYYQVIIKGASEKWLDSQIFDSDLVREMGIVPE